MISCMGRLRAPICWLDDWCHRWFPWTFCGHWAERPDQTCEPFLCRLHYNASDRYWQKKLGPEEGL